MIRAEKVIVDADLAELFGVTTKRLNEQVRRNKDRFPTDFAFRLTRGEKAEVVANCDHLARLKFSSTLPMVFTEHGAMMAAGVLKRFTPSRKNGRFSGKKRAKRSLAEICPASDSICEKSGLIVASMLVDGLGSHLASTPPP